MTATTARPARLALLALAIAVVPAPAPARAADDVALESLTFDAFKARLTAPAGKTRAFKYTLVDAWSTTCAPCMENFPHLVEMHRKYAAKGLRTVSLSLDDTSDAKAVEAARAFLRKQKATFLNVLLNEDYGVGFEKLDINAIPAVFVYDPNGKLVKKYTMDDPNYQFTYAQVEKDVAAMLGASR